MFPTNAVISDRDNENLSNALFGNRIYSDQTLVEYLIEFLLVFTSAKDKDGNGRMQFHTQEQIEQSKLAYYVKPNVALRRFIFYERSKQDSRSAMDTEANLLMKQHLHDVSEDREDIELIHDLLLSYAIVTRNRGWYAQALMPVSEEMIIPDIQGIKARQRMRDYDIDSSVEIDGTFDFNKHNFLARGGQVLYLHLLQAMADSSELNSQYREKLERGLHNMLTCSGEGVQLLSSFVQNTWEESRTDESKEKAYDLREYNMGYIRDAYSIRSERFLKEVTQFLSNDIHPITRIELLSQGMVLSLLRIMHIISAKQIDESAEEPIWIMDMCHMGGTSNIARLSSETCSSAINAFQTAMVTICKERDIPPEERFSLIQKGKKNAGDVFKRLAKEIKLIIPPTGDNERFSLSEVLVRYLVLALVPPESKITLDRFLERLYEHFRMVIGPSQYRMAFHLREDDVHKDMSDYFTMNQNEFQEFLKRCGFLRDLSDATAIVENPYREVHLA